MEFRRALASNTLAAAFAISGAAMSASSALAQTQPEVGAQPQAPATTTLTRTEWNPYFPPELLGLAGLLCLGFCGYAAHKKGMKGTATAAYAFAGAVLVYGAANHQKITDLRVTLPTEALLVVDASPSQSLGTRATSTAEAETALTASLAALPGVNTRIIRIGGETNGMAASSTRMLDRIDEALSDVPAEQRGGVFILSDGQVHDKITAQYGVGKDVPVHAMISGRAGEYDRRLEKLEVPNASDVNKTQDIKFILADDGPVPRAGGKTKVTIHHDGKLVGSQMVTPGQPETARVEVTHAGTNIFEIKTDTVAGEVTDVNNRIVATIEGNHEKLNVLLISGSPNPNTLMWRKLLKADPNVNPIHFMVQRYPEQIDDTPREEYALTPFPMNEVFSENQKRFHVIILDNYENRHLLSGSYIENIANRIKEGGSLIVAAGAEYAGPGSLYKTPLGAVLPGEPTNQVTARAFRPRISDQGHKHPVTRNLEGGNVPKDNKSQPTWGPWFLSVDVIPHSGTVVMENDSKNPLVILSYQGKGRVAMINSDSISRWYRSFDGKGPYAPLLSNMAHWAMKSPAMDEEALKIMPQGKDLLIEQQTMADKSTPVTLTTPSGKSMTVTPEAYSPGLWHIKVPANEPGLYKVEQTGKYPRVAITNVGPDNAQEFVHTISTQDILEPLVTRTGGRMTRMTDAAGVLTLPAIRAIAPDSKDRAVTGEGWVGVRMTSASKLESTKREQVVDNRILAALLFLSMATAFIMQSGKNPFRRDKAPVTPSGHPAPTGPG